MTTQKLGHSHHHAWNTPENMRRWLDEIEATDPPTRVLDLVEKYRGDLEVYGRLTEPQARVVKDLWEERC